MQDLDHKFTAELSSAPYALFACNPQLVTRNPKRSEFYVNDLASLWSLPSKL